MPVSETIHARPDGGRRPIWKSAGLHLTGRLDSGWLAVSPDLLRAYYTRPEIHPIETSCRNEHLLFEKLMEVPDAPVADAELTAIADRDAADNYRLLLRYRDHLLKHGSIEAGYRALFETGAPQVPPVFIEQLVHLIISNMLDGESDVFILRAAELFFRDQKATVADDRLMLADAEVVEMYSQTGGLGGLGALLAEAGTAMREVSLDVLTEENAASYPERADQFNFALDFRFTQPGQDALARVIERWIVHFFRLPVRVQAVRSITDERWSWHVGLDAQATQILNALYEGVAVGEDDLGRIMALFRLEFLEQDRIIETMRGKPAYLGMAMTTDGLVRLKPQNLLTNLPLKDDRQ
ncbi:hypothetical protein NTH_00141 [Nitratireductor thuwali]|uniref:Uncharacterized protein n=1 Tax=Nitratireductor thuwali TaxID=2267699 RepID=A0ABY5MG46_9HYPH|nr:hypothetical protein NTH_00141 [Nitratireductor thuwali]